MSREKKNDPDKCGWDANKAAANRRSSFEPSGEPGKAACQRVLSAAVGLAVRGVDTFVSPKITAAVNLRDPSGIFDEPAVTAIPDVEEAGRFQIKGDREVVGMAA